MIEKIIFYSHSTIIESSLTFHLIFDCECRISALKVLIIFIYTYILCGLIFDMILDPHVARRSTHKLSHWPWASRKSLCLATAQFFLTTKTYYNLSIDLMFVVGIAETLYLIQRPVCSAIVYAVLIYKCPALWRGHCWTGQSVIWTIPNQRCSLWGPANLDFEQTAGQDVQLLC